MQFCWSSDTALEILLKTVRATGDSAHVSILQGTASAECMMPLPAIIHPNPYLGLLPRNPPRLHSGAENTQDDLSAKHSGVISKLFQIIF